MRLLLTVLTAAALGLAAPASAQTSKEHSITEIRTGWNADSFAIVTAEPMINPANCPTPDGYISDKSFPGYQTYYAAALTAIATQRWVTITVDNSQCFIGRPKIIGINVGRP